LQQIFEWAASASDAPLPFFPRSSRKFAEQLDKKSAEDARREALKIFEGSDSLDFGIPPESEEELEMQRLWEGWSPIEADAGGAGPLTVSFDELAAAFFAPLLAAREVARE
jgi:hypothetical protein